MRHEARGRLPGPTDDTNRPADAPWPRRARTLEPVELEEAADGVGDLLVALLADHEAVVGMRPERLERRAQPLRQPLGPLDRDLAVECRADDELRDADDRPRIHGHALEHLAPGEAALVGLLAEHVLDPG